MNLKTLYPKPRPDTILKSRHPLTSNPKHLGLHMIYTHQKAPDPKAPKHCRTMEELKIIVADMKQQKKKLKPPHSRPILLE